MVRYSYVRNDKRKDDARYDIEDSYAPCVRERVIAANLTHAAATTLTTALNWYQEARLLSPLGVKA